MNPFFALKSFSCVDECFTFQIWYSISILQVWRNESERREEKKITKLCKNKNKRIERITDEEWTRNVGSNQRVWCFKQQRNKEIERTKWNGMERNGTQKEKTCTQIRRVKSFLHALFSVITAKKEVFCHLKFAWNRIKYAKYTLFTNHKVWLRKASQHSNKQTHARTHARIQQNETKIRRKAKEISSWWQWHILIIHDRATKTHATFLFGQNCGEFFLEPFCMLFGSPCISEKNLKKETTSMNKEMTSLRSNY